MSIFEPSEVEVQDQVRKWGWETPVDSVRENARLALQLSAGMRAGEALVALGALSADDCERLLEVKPAGKKTLEWVTEQDPTLIPWVDRILTLKTENGTASYAYYSDLSALSLHPVMAHEAVLLRADRAEAIVMLIEGVRPVIVFADYKKLVAWESLSAHDLEKDEILKALAKYESDSKSKRGRASHADRGPVSVANVRHWLAVGVRDEVSGMLRNATNEDIVSSFQQEAKAFWDGGAPDTGDHPEILAFNRMIDYALRNKVTDIAIQPFHNGAGFVRMRIYGRLTPFITLPFEVNAQLIRLLAQKSGANPTAAILREPADGQITYRSSAGTAFLRISLVPLNHPQDRKNLTSVSIRLLSRDERSVNFEALNLHPSVQEEVRFAVSISQGLTLLCGPTNSGKSTTIAAALNEDFRISGDTRKRVSIEQPIERFLKGLMQIQVDEVTGDGDEQIGMEDMLRSLKRHDPDVIWVGEVRDRATANLCVAASGSGHIVLSTIHAANEVAAIDTLAKMVSPDMRLQLIESLSLIISQRLVRQVCPACSEERDITQDERKTFEVLCGRFSERVVKLPVRMRVAKRVSEIAENGGARNLSGRLRSSEQSKKGCGHPGCVDGYIGQLPINGVLACDEEVKALACKFVEGDYGARASLGTVFGKKISLMQNAVELIENGMTDLAAVLEM